MTSALFFESWAGVGRIVLAAVSAYAALIVLLRASGKRTLSKMNAFDLVVTVALGSSFATVILSKRVPLLEGIVAFAMLIGLQLVVAWASGRWMRVQRLVKSQPALLYYGGEFQQQALRRERVTASEVRAAIRQQGFGSLEEVEAVIIETAGDLSVIRKGPHGTRDALVDARPPARS